VRPLHFTVGPVQAWVVARHSCHAQPWGTAVMNELGRPVAAVGLRWIRPQATSDDVTLLAGFLRAGSFSLGGEARA
jgi:hypothetical protein